MDMCGYSGVKSFAEFCLKPDNFVSISKRIAESDKKVDIQTSEVDIETPKVDIGRICKNKIPGITEKSIQHVIKMYDKYTTVGCFGRSDVTALLNLSPAMTSRLLKTLLDNHIIEPVKGLGKGKYRFSAKHND